MLKSIVAAILALVTATFGALHHQHPEPTLLPTRSQSAAAAVTQDSANNENLVTQQLQYLSSASPNQVTSSRQVSTQSSIHLSLLSNSTFVTKDQLAGLLSQFARVVSLLPRAVSGNSSFVSNDFFIRQNDRTQDSIGDAVHGIKDSLNDYVPIDGGTITGNLSVNSFAVGGSSTSTAQNGFNITRGCFAISGSCVGLGSFSGLLSVGSGGTGWTNINSGSILFGNGSGALATSSNFFWDAANGRLGIGTSTPSALLTIFGSNASTNLVSGGGVLTAITNADQTNGNFDSLSYRMINSAGAEITGTRISGIFSSHTAGAESADLAFLTRNSGTLSEKMRLTAGGFLGIGTTSPSATLSVSGNGYFTGGLTLASTAMITPNYAGPGALSAALTFNDPSPLTGSTSIGFGVGVSSPVLQIVTNNPANTLGITNTNLSGIAAVTLRGKDNTYTDNTTVFEHGAFFWLPTFGSGANQGLLGIEASRYDTANNPMIPPPDFQIQQTGGIDPTGGTTQSCSITNTSTSITCGSALPANGSLITGVGTDISAATTLISGGGSTSGVMSKAATATNASASINFSNPTYAVRTVMNSIPGGNLNFPGWDGTNMLSLDRVNKWIGILNTAPTAPLDVGGNARIGGTLSFAGASYGIVSPGNVLHVGNVDSASPVVQTIGFQNVLVGTSNTGAANAIIQGPLGTGTGAGGSIFLKTSPGGVSGTTQNTGITRFTVLNFGQVLVSSSTASIAPENGAGVPLFQVQSAANNPRNNAIAVYAYGASSNAPANLYLEQSNSNTLGTQTAVVNNTTLGQITGGGSDGTNFQNSSRILFQSDGNVSAGIVPGRVVFQTAGAAGTLTEAMRINNSGNVGIGTTTPWAQLSASSTSANPALAIQQNSTGPAGIFLGGNIGVGTTSPWRTLSVAGTIGFSGLTNDTADQKALCLTAAGEVVANTGSSCITSSQRFKNNIEPLDSTSGLAEIMGLSPVSFAYKPEIGIPGTQVGFIAEQIQTVDPRLVVLDASGTPFTVRYENLTAILAKAIQEIATISGTFRDNLIEWLGDASNGIHDLYAGIIHSQEDHTQLLCVGTTCVSPQQFQTIVAAAGQFGTAPTGQGSAPSSGPATPPSSDATTTDAATTPDQQSGTTTSTDGSVSPPSTPPDTTPLPASADPSH